MSAISGTRRALRELADGSIRVQIDIDPRFKADFHRLFPAIDMPVALAPLALDFERIEEKSKGPGPLCRLAGIWCKEKNFHRWLESIRSKEAEKEEAEVNELYAAVWIRTFCEVESRRDLDHDDLAASLFHEHIRLPFMAWLEEQNQ